MIKKQFGDLLAEYNKLKEIAALNKSNTFRDNDKKTKIDVLNFLSQEVYVREKK